MTTLIEKAPAIAAALTALDFIESATVWTKVAGKERIYVEVMRADRDGGRFGGVGGKMHIDLTTGKVMSLKTGYNGTCYCNSYTADFHKANGSVAKILAIVSEA
jgi:hypothetical protein